MIRARACALSPFASTGSLASPPVEAQGKHVEDWTKREAELVAGVSAGRTGQIGSNGSGRARCQCETIRQIAQASALIMTITPNPCASRPSV